MKIALINENSQAAKNALIESTLRKVVEPMGHEVVNYGMYTAEDAAQLTYVQNGILAAVLLNSGAADYVITGCGTGEGAMLALNSFPGVICGHVEDPVDAYTFAHVNDGNAVALPFAKLTTSSSNNIRIRLFCNVYRLCQAVFNKLIIRIEKYNIISSCFINSLISSQ